ncbi:MAG: exodeoxyribonuclease VII large subunit, partial [Bacteriovoracaceae bacterium]|nr:exodeoxyribonuclease VII large subunit [Bacteriovoracaceae bacterium]
MARPLKVSEILVQIKGLLESTFPEVLVEGEVSNFAKASSGHYYFSLSDETASIAVAFFRGDALLNPLLKTLTDGQKVIVVGRIGVYPKRGTFQIIGAKIYPFGAGNLKIQFELLKKQLAEKGLFDLEHKKSIPPFPRRVAIITALDGAALQDFRQVYQRRSVVMDILVVPSLVQGEQAPASLRAALKKVLAYNQALQEHPSAHPGELPIEVVVLARGGGSMEDLWCFNDEALAYAIYEFPLPIISAVGHQVDFTIADFVADHRAETPTAAAEVLTAAQVDLQQRLGRGGQHLKQAMRLILAQAQRQLAQVHPRRWEQALRRRWQEAQAKIA